MIVFKNLNPIEVNEGDGQIILEIDPTASGITEATSLQISTSEGSAISTSFGEGEAGVDFDAIDDSIVSVNPDDPDSFSFTINITDDTLAEDNEDFQFQVTGIEDESLTGTANVFILDNDGSSEPDLVVEGLLPRISIADVELLEGDSGSTNFDFMVSLSEASDELITVDYATAEGTAESEDILENSTLVDIADFIPTTGTLEFNPGETEKTFSIEVLTDTLALSAEAPDERFFINLSNANNANIDELVAVGIILDDDFENTENNAILTLTIENQSLTEGDLGELTTQEVTVSLLDENGELFLATEDINFSYSTEDREAISDVDYEFVDDQSATILQGQSSTSIPLTIIGDNSIEAAETFILNLNSLNTDLAQVNSNEIEITITDNDGFDEEEEENADIDINDIRDSNVFRLFNSSAGIHLYTTDETERDFLLDNLDTYQLEDSSFSSVSPGNLDNAAEVYRFFNTLTGGHLYTTNETERDFIIDNLDNFVFEDVAFFAFETNEADTIPVYRFYEENRGIHFYTGNETERAFIQDNLANFSFEGIAYYALPTENISP